MKEGDFILQVTFAWEGAIAIVSALKTGCMVRHAIRLFASINRGAMLTFSSTIQDGGRSPSSGQHCPGSAGRNRVFEHQANHRIMIPLPPRGAVSVVARIEELAAQIAEARTLRLQAAAETEHSHEKWSMRSWVSCESKDVSS